MFHQIVARWLATLTLVILVGIATMAPLGECAVATGGVICVG
ncbi:MAG: hypothetical protein AB1791_05115 [Chloroflexota bacterium]